ncbi:general secretion pathway protein GspB [Thiohalomonas denitrificans]|uniref:General secretion pathway protein B n=1 Tax=Thiohalomonas denitrificans TaxID=415747 RepID=A0A1G5QJT3_9GAMM|nr:general secretion pathway protein GspB [Thiohalomonas denitrificans]SCZ62074.1 general secretion pathway protein B [Thiohalomonas denitrificans]
MSYILEALNKSQREHARGSVPTLQGQALSLRPVRRIGPLVIALLLGALVALFIVGYVFRGQYFGTGTVSSLSMSGADIRSESPASESPENVERPSLPAAKPEPLPVVEIDSEPEPLRPTGDQAGTNGSVKSPAAPPSAPVRQPPAKAWSELPVDIRRTIGNLVLNIHVYSERPEKRFVFINEREYGEGDVLKEGPTLEAIEPGGLVLAFREERFRIGM